MNKKVYLFVMVSFVVGMSELVVGGILDLIATQLEVSVSTAGLLITVFAIVFALAAPILFVLFSKLDRKKLMLFALFVFFIGNVLALISHTFTSLLFSRIISAASGSVATVLSINLASRVVEAAYRGRAIGLVVMGISGSLVLGLPIGVLLGNTIHWKAPFALIALLTIGLLFSVSNSLPNVAPTKLVSIREQLGSLRQGKVLFAHLTTFFFMTGHYTMYAYLTPYATEVLSFNGYAISILYLIFGIAAVSGGGLSGLAADHFGVRPSLLFTILILICSLFGLPFLSNIPLVFCLLSIVWGIVSWGITPSIQTHLLSIAPETAEIQQSLNNTALQFGIAFGTLYGGLVIEAKSIENLAHYGIVFIVLSLFTALMTTSNKEKERMA